MDPDQLEIFIDEAVKNEDEAIKKAFQESGLEEEEFASEFKIPLERLNKILSSQ